MKEMEGFGSSSRKIGDDSYNSGNHSPANMNQMSSGTWEKKPMVVENVIINEIKGDDMLSDINKQDSITGNNMHDTI